jgi:hypothetical protein
LIIVTFPTIFKAFLKGLKQTTFKGCSAWDVCEGNVTISNPNACAYSIASRVTWDPWTSKMSKCLFVKEIPLGIDLLKKENKSLKINAIIHAFD